MKPKYNSLSQEYLDKADLTHRKNLGQYFTPAPVREHLLSRLPRQKGATVLDPACGSGEFLASAADYFGNCRLHGWEIDPKLVRLARETVPGADIEKTNSLQKTVDRSFDFVIGNPPYFEFKPEPALRERYRDVIRGRVNIFSMFVKLGLDVLVPGGYLAYVIPPSMNNGAYFARLRDYITANANIEYLRVLESSALFHSAQQMVMILVLRKGRNRGDFVFDRNGIKIFSTDTDRLRDAFRGTKTLRDLGLVVRTGRIVWNQHKEKLRESASGAIPLIRAHNITGQGLILENAKDKPQYIGTNDADTGPAVVVNRVTGASQKAQLKAAFIKPGYRFVGENHVNVISPPPSMGRREATRLLKAVCRQINDPQTTATMRLVTGNTQISRTELERLMPLRIRAGS